MPSSNSLIYLSTFFTGCLATDSLKSPSCFPVSLVLDFTITDQAGKSRDPLVGLLSETANNVNRNIKETSVELADILGKYTNLKKLDKLLGKEAGADIQRGELLLQRVFSPSKGTNASELLTEIQKETGIDLFEDAALAKLSSEQFAGEAELIGQQVASGLQGLTYEGLKGGGLQSFTNFFKEAMKGDPEKLINFLIRDKKTAGQIIVDALQGNITRAVQSLNRLRTGKEE